MPWPRRCSFGTVGTHEDQPTFYPVTPAWKKGKILVLNSGRCWVIRYCKRANLLVFLQPGESTKVRRTASSLRTLAALAFGDSARRVRIPGRNQERRRVQHSLGLGFRLRHP